MQNTFLRRLLMVLVTGAGAVSLSACNTVEGAGRDVEAAGEKVQDVAD